MSHSEACRAALRTIDAAEQTHIARLDTALRDIEGVVVHGPLGNRPRVAVLSMNIADLPAEQTGAMLDADHHVCVRPGLHCAPLVHEDQSTVGQLGTVRFSPGYFTGNEDIEMAIAAVRELAAD